VENAHCAWSQGSGSRVMGQGSGSGVGVQGQGSGVRVATAIHTAALTISILTNLKWKEGIRLVGGVGGVSVCGSEEGSYLRLIDLCITQL